MNKAKKYESIENSIPDGTTKGEVMKMAYSKKEIVNIDASLPIDRAINSDSFWKVMNYNYNVLGELQDMRDVLIHRK
tara:strand:+ start:1016 stop:1246 length:231 start_codon:yes stop_codon:yes gene_type:complete